MRKCVLCGEELDPQSDQNYSYDRFLHEMDRQGFVYCRQCREILRTDRSRNIPKEKLIRVAKISESDYYLPGFVLSKDRTHYIRPTKRKSILKRVMGFGKSLR